MSDTGKGLPEVELKEVSAGDIEQNVGNWFCPHWFKRVNKYTCQRCNLKENCDTYKEHK